MTDKKEIQERRQRQGSCERLIQELCFKANAVKIMIKT